MTLFRFHNAFDLNDVNTVNDEAGIQGQDGSNQFSALTLTLPTIPTTTGVAQTLYLQQSGDTSKVSVNDIHQGQLGDCFLLSSIGELALNAPNAIPNMIHANANGTETVTLYTDLLGRLPTFGTMLFKATSVTVNNSFSAASVNNGATQDVVGNLKEIWPQVIEKAVATLDGGYSAIASGGNPVIAMEELTGHAATFMSPNNLTQAGLKAMLAVGDLITMDTSSQSNLPNNLVSNHAYMVEGMTTAANGTAMVQLGNPWGTNQPGAIPFAQLAKSMVEVDVGHFR
jgi:hypothetical protein